jgi:hypothetical protein
VSYLNCPSCHLSMNAGSAKGLFDRCPRCAASYGRTSFLYESPLPVSKLAPRQAALREVETSRSVPAAPVAKLGG